MPIERNGQAVGDVTLNGNTIDEVTVNGQTVFSGKQLPVAYSNLVAWYPFDSAEYGGANADDVTAILGGSGDDTAYDGTVNGATYQSSGGVKDINAGANSGGFDFDNNDDTITTLYNGSADSICFWANTDRTFTGNDTRDVLIALDGNILISFGSITGSFSGETISVLDSPNRSLITNTVNAGVWNHYAFVFDTSVNGNFRIYLNGVEENVEFNDGDLGIPNGQFALGARIQDNAEFYDGQLDDVRFYDKSLSSSEINNIYNATEP